MIKYLEKIRQVIEELTKKRFTGEFAPIKTMNMFS
jgi:hypothetical protein